MTARHISWTSAADLHRDYPNIGTRAKARAAIPPSIRESSTIMKAGLIALASALAAGAVPTDKVFPFDGAVESLVPPPVDDWTALQGGVANLVGGAIKKVTEAIQSAFKGPPIFRWRGSESERELEFIQHGDITCRSTYASSIYSMLTSRLCR